MVSGRPQALLCRESRRQKRRPNTGATVAIREPRATRINTEQAVSGNTDKWIPLLRERGGVRYRAVAKRKQNDLLARARNITIAARELREERQSLSKLHAAIRKDFERATGEPETDLTLLHRLKDERRRQSLI